MQCWTPLTLGQSKTLPSTPKEHTKHHQDAHNIFVHPHQYGISFFIREEGEALLKREVRHVERAIEKLIKAEIKDNMHAAIGSFAYNCGTRALQRLTFRQYINQGRYDDAADELPRWCRAGGKKIPGLLRRRYAERELFLS